MSLSKEDLELVTSVLTDLDNMLYSLPGCGFGGPLHVVLDDFNLNDKDLDWCKKNSLVDEEWSPVIRRLCRCIVELLQHLTPAQRAVWRTQHRHPDLIQHMLNVVDMPYEIAEAKFLDYCS